MFELYKPLKHIAENEYKDIVTKTLFTYKKTIGSGKLRIFLIDSSFVDVWLSRSGKYSYHWEARAKRGAIYRFDNAPDHPEMDTFPKHFHEGDEKKVESSNLSSLPEKAIREVLNYVRDKLHSSLPRAGDNA